MKVLIVLCIAATLSVVLANPVPESIDMLRIPLQGDKVCVFFFKLILFKIFTVIIESK